MILLAGLRDHQVGTDTGAYVRGFERTEINQEEEEVDLGVEFNGREGTLKGKEEMAIDKEPAYKLLVTFSKHLSDNYAALLILVALLVYALVLKSIHDVSRYELVSLFAFITLGLYTFSFNAARQGIAVAIYAQAIPFILRRQFWKYVIVVLIAALFHKTVIVTLPLYFLFTMRYNWKSLLVVILGIIVLTSVMNQLLDFGATVEDRYKLYTEESTSGGEYLTIFYTVLMLFFMFQRRYIKEQYLKRYDLFLLMNICSAVIYLIVILMELYIEVSRFAAYFQISSIFLWAEVFRRDNFSVKWVYVIGFVTVHLLFYGIFLSRMAGLVPYEFNQTLFGDEMMDAAAWDSLIH